MAIQFSNLASTTLASGVSSSATSVSVTSASLFPTLGGGDYFYATLGAGTGSEIVKVTAISGTTFTVIRGQDGTTAVSHSAGVDCALRVTAAALEDLRDSPNVESVSKSGDIMTGTLTMGSNAISSSGTISSGAITASGHIVTNTSSRIENQRISMEPDGTLDWGSSKQYGTLTWDTNKAIVVAQSGSSLEFRTDNSGVALRIDTSQNSTFLGTISSGAITSSGAISATEYDLPSGGMLDWANGDARIVEGLVNNYSLSFQTYDGSALSTALRLDGNNNATFHGNIKIANGKLYLNTNEDAYIFGDSNSIDFAQWNGSGYTTNLTISDTGNATFSGTINSGAITSSGKIKTTGGELEFTSHNHQLTTGNANNIKLKIGTTGAAGIALMDSANSFALQVYGDSSGWGFLNAEWGAWNLRKAPTGGLYLNNNNTYYINPAATSNLNLVQAQAYKIGSTNVIDSSRNITATTGNFTELVSTQSSHNYLRVRSSGAGEAMIRYGNTVSADWYVGLRNQSSNSITNTGYHFYSNTAGATVGGWNADRNFYTSNNATIAGTISSGAITSTGLTANVPSLKGLIINSADVSVIQFNVANGGQKNWGFASTYLAAGDFGLYQSNSTGGNPITAGAAKLYFTSTGAATFSSTISSGDITAPSFSGASFGAASGAPDSTIWAVSRDTYPDYGIFYDQGNPDKILYKWAGVTKFNINMETGALDTPSTITASGGTISGNLTVNNNLYIGDGDDGYFYNDTAGRTAFRSGDFYIQDTVTNFYNYATNQYYGDNSGDNIHFRGNVLNGTGWSINGAGMLTTRDHLLNAGYHLQRADHHSGHLEGSYNNVGANESQSNPIYSIGSAYNPSSTTLGNMYGIGFSYSSASFINFSGGAGWGMYVAADGDARVWLNGSAGTIASTGQHYVGSNVVWNAGNDGSGSGLDADLFDGVDSTVFFKSPSNVSGWQNSNANFSVQSGDASNVGLHMEQSNGVFGFQLYASNGLYGFLDGEWASWDIQKAKNGAFKVDEGSGLKRVLNEANWSSYITLPTDADTIDGRGFVNTGSNSGQNSDTINSNGISYYTSGVSNFSGNSTDGALYSQQYSSSWQHQIAGDYRSGQIAVRGKNNGTWTAWNKVWTAGNDGSTSGLDADFLDGVEGASYLRSDAADSFTGTLTMGTQKALVANNYGRGVYGLYSSTAHQHVWSMGTAYNLADNGASVGNLYGISYTHTNVGTGYGANSAVGLGHQLNGRANGTLQWALGDGIYSAVTGNVWGASNDGSGSGLDADFLDGLDLHAGRNNEANKVVRTNGSGYIDAGWINTISGATTSTMNRIYASDDGYIRYYTPANFGAQLSQHINFTNIANNKILPTSGNYVWSASTLASGYSPVGISTSFVRSNEGWPEYGTVLHVGGRGGSDAGGDFQLFSGHGAANGGNYLRVRNADNSASPTDSWTAFRTIWDSGNDGSGSGLDADLLDGQHGAYYYSKTNMDAGRNIVSGTDLDTDLANGGAFSSYGSGGTSWNAPFSYGGVLGWSFTSGIEGQIGFDIRHNQSVYSDFWFRGKNNLGFNPWSKVWHTLNDGSGSGLDADLLDGKDSILFTRYRSVFGSGSNKNWNTEIADVGGSGRMHWDEVHNISTSWTNGPIATFSSAYTYGGVQSVYLGSQKYQMYVPHLASNGNGVYYRSGWGASQWYDWRVFLDSGNISSYAWTSSNDGSGSGLDADTVDGIQGASLLRSDADDTATGQYSFSKVNDHAIRVGTIRGTAVGSQGGEYIQMYERVHIGSPVGWGTRGAPSYGLSTYGGADFATDTGSVTISGNTAWHAGNDGSGSGLDADLFDGQDSPRFFKSFSSSAPSAWERNNANFSVRGGDSSNIGLHMEQSNGVFGFQLYSSNGTYGFLDGEWAGWDIQKVANGNFSVDEGSGLNRVWNAGNDGSGSGLDADLLDGLDSTDFARFGGTSHNRTIPNRWFATGDNDNNIDYYTHLYAKAHMGNTYKYTTSRPARTTDSNYWVGTMGWGAIDMNTLFSYGSGDIDAWGNPANQPSGTSHWVGSQTLHYHNGSTGYGTQRVTGAGSPALTYIRGIWGGGFTSWFKDWNAANDGAGSGLDADLLDGYNAEEGAVNNSIVKRDGGAMITAKKLYLNGGNYEGQIVFGAVDAWRTGIRQHDDADAELRIWAKNTNGRIHIATGYDGQPASLTRPTDGFVVDHNNVGIGNFDGVDPSEKLHVKGNILASGNVTGLRLYTTDGTNTISTFVSSSYNQITSTGSAFGGARDLRFNFGQSGTAMTVKSGQVHMAKTVLVDGPTMTGTSTSGIISAANADTSSVTSHHISFTKSNGTTSLGRITTNNTATTYTTSSDYRLKEDLQEISGATAKVLSIQPRNFRWVGTDARTDGFLAHELAPIVPDAVVGTKDAMTTPTLYLEDEELPEGVSVGDVKVASVPDYQSVDQSKLVPLLVKTIQELEARITALESA